jgi:hypothetical protein
VEISPGRSEAGLLRLGVRVCLAIGCACYGLDVAVRILAGRVQLDRTGFGEEEVAPSGDSDEWNKKLGGTRYL